MIITQLLNEEIVQSGLSKDLLATHYISILTYFAIDIYVQTRKTALIITIVILSIMMFDAVVTYFQYINLPIGWYLGQIFFNVKDVKLDKILATVDHYNGQLLLNMSLAGGIFGDSVKNGYLLTSYGILAICFALKKSFHWSSVLGWICIAVFVSTSFMVQQRMAFIILCIMILYFIFRYSSKVLVVIMLMIATYMILFHSVELDNDNMGRLSHFEVDNTRIYIYSNAWDFVQNYIFLGGPVTFYTKYGVYPHNFFFNAFIYGGFLGALIVIYLFFEMLWYGFRVIISGHTLLTLDMVYAAGLISFLLIGLTHNSSLITGDTSIWFLLAMMIRINQLNKKTYDN